MLEETRSQEGDQVYGKNVGEEEVEKEASDEVQEYIPRSERSEAKVRRSIQGQGSAPFSAIQPHYACWLGRAGRAMPARLISISGRRPSSLMHSGLVLKPVGASGLASLHSMLARSPQNALSRFLTHYGLGRMGS